jgi:hypothetical protein
MRHQSRPIRLRGDSQSMRPATLIPTTRAPLGLPQSSRPSTRRLSPRGQCGVAQRRASALMRRERRAVPNRRHGSRCCRRQSPQEK